MSPAAIPIAVPHHSRYSSVDRHRSHMGVGSSEARRRHRHIHSRRVVSWVATSSGRGVTTVSALAPSLSDRAMGSRASCASHTEGEQHAESRKDTADHSHQDYRR
jgi:hypothetical protein